MKALRLCATAAALLLCASLFSCGNTPATKESTTVLTSTGEKTEQEKAETSTKAELIADNEGLQCTGVYYYPISLLPWLYNFCTAQSGRGDMFSFGYIRNEKMNESFPCEFYETSLSTPSTTDYCAYLQRAYPYFPFEEHKEEIQQCTATNGLPFVCLEDKSEQKYYVAALFSERQILCGVFSTENPMPESALTQMMSTLETIPDTEYYDGTPYTEKKCLNGEALTSKAFEIGDADRRFSISVLLPTSWSEFTYYRPFGGTDIYYAENGYPELYPPTKYTSCIYQAFSISCFSSPNAELPDFNTDSTIITASAFPCTLYAKEVPDYHAIEYRGFIQIDADTTLAVMLCVDEDNNDIVKEIIGSIQIQL